MALGRQKTLQERVEDFKSDLDLLTRLLEQLKREYDLFFAGARKRQPLEMRQQVERMLRKWQATNIQKVELTFRLNTLQSKYNSMTDVWEKVLKRRETDPRAFTPYGPTAAQVAAAMAAERGEIIPPESSVAERQAERRREQQNADPETRMRSLFDQFLDAKRDLGEQSAISYEKFRNQLEKQTSSIREKTNCKDVQFQVVRKNGKVSLTAKPIR